MASKDVDYFKKNRLIVYWRLGFYPAPSKKWTVQVLRLKSMHKNANIFDGFFVWSVACFNIHKPYFWKRTQVPV